MQRFQQTAVCHHFKWLRTTARQILEKAENGQKAASRVKAGQAALSRGDFDAAERETRAARGLAPWDTSVAELRRQLPFPPDQVAAVHAALVAAGAAAGDLPGALAEIARHAERRARVTATLRSALFAPLVTATFVLTVGTALLVFIGPRLREIVTLTGGGGDVRLWRSTFSRPPSTRARRLSSSRSGSFISQWTRRRKSSA